MLRNKIVKTVVMMTMVLATLLMSSVMAMADSDQYPKIVPLPNGWRPEGLVVGRGHTLYAGSLGTGAIYRADLKSGAGDVLVPPQAGRVAVGLSYDQRSHFIFAAGGPGGAGYVYDAASGAGVAAYNFAAAPTFVNDVIVTKKAAYFTDSMRPVIYRVPLGPGGRVPAQSAVAEIALGGDFVFVPGAFNANGIEATSNGKWLIVVHSSRGELYRVDPDSGDAVLIDLGGASVSSGDGLLLHGRTLYVVRNSLNQIAVVELNKDLTSGQVVETITDPAFRVPTTIAKFGSRLYVVNARFGTPPEPTTEYEVVQVDR